MMRAIAALGLLLQGTLAGAQESRLPQQPRGTIAGEVVDASTMQVLEGATVILSPGVEGAVLPPLRGASANFAIARSIVTGPTGRYTFDDLPVGDYQLRVQRIGYRPATIGVRLNASSNARVSVGLNVAPIRLHPIAVRAEAAASYGRMESGTEQEPDVRVTAARIRQHQFLATDVRELTHPDVTEAVTLGESDLFRAFQRLPSVTTRDDYTAELWTRSARADLTRLYFDGLPLFGPYHTFGLLTGVGTEAVGAAILHPGVRPPSTGEGGAAVIDVRSRPGGGSGDVRGLAELSLLSGRLALDQRSRDDQWGWMVAARRSYLDWLLAAIGAMSREKDLGYPYHFGDLAARLDHQLGGDRAIEASGLLTRDVIDDDVFEVLRGDRVAWGNGAVRVSFVGPLHGFRARHTVGVSRFAARTDTLHATPLDSILTTPHTAPHYSPAEVPARSSLLYMTATGELERATAGADFPWSFGYSLAAQRTRMSENVRDASLLRNGSSIGRIPTADDSWLASLWVRRRWRLTSRLTLEPGLRVEGGARIGNAGVVRPLPRIQARFRADSQTSFSVGLGRSMQYTQAIGRTEWGRDALLMASPLWIIADSGVPALIADVATLGAERWLGAAWLLSANAYHRWSTGYVLRDPTPGVAFARQLVVGRERAAGVELSARKLAGRVTGSAGYTMAAARTRAAGLEFPSSQDRRHSVDVAMLARLTPTLNAGAAYTFATGAPYTRIHSALERDAQGNWHMTPARAEEPNAQRMRAHASLDLLLEWAFGGGRTRWVTFLQLRNVLDRENPLVFLTHNPCTPETPSFGPCGDRFNAGVRRIPVVGIRVSF